MESTAPQIADQSKASARPTLRHIPALDGVRGVAILMVLFGHFYQNTWFNGSLPKVAMVTGRVAGAGGWGVELFFVLSGFLITGILLDTRESAGALRKFYTRRILRIFPLYYGTLAVIFFVLPHFVTFDAPAKKIVEHQGWLWTYLINHPWAEWIWDESNLFLLGHFWSLCVEEHFYIFWPLLVFALSRRSLFAVCLAFVGIGIVTRTLPFVFSPDRIPWLLNWNTLQKIDGLSIGALVAVALRDPELIRWLPTKRNLEIGLIATGSLFFAICMIPARVSLPPVKVLGETIIVLFFALVLVKVLRAEEGTPLKRFFTSRILIIFGVYSYGIYIFHGILRPLFSKLFNALNLPEWYLSPLLNQALYYGFSIALSLLFAVVSYHLFERRFLALKRFAAY